MRMFLISLTQISVSELAVLDYGYVGYLKLWDIGCCLFSGLAYVVRGLGKANSLSVGVDCKDISTLCFELEKRL